MASVTKDHETIDNKTREIVDLFDFPTERLEKATKLFVQQLSMAQI